MARVPALPYRVVVTKKLNGNQQQLEQHNYASIAGAIVYREIALRRPNTKKVEMIMVLDESTPGHPE